MERIAVIGASGSGKTTLAFRLAQRLGMLHVELDALHWDANWTPAPRELFRERVTHALSGDTWVIDGNYGAVRDIVWARADTIVWLDYDLLVVLARVTGRTVRRAITQEELWNQNREHFRESIFSRESIILWALTTYCRRRRETPVLLARPEHAHLAVVHLRSPRAASRWLATQGPEPHN